MHPVLYISHLSVVKLLFSRRVTEQASDLLIYGLFNDALSCTDVVASNVRAITERWIRTDMGGGGRGLFQCIISEFALGVVKNRDALFFFQNSMSNLKILGAIRAKWNRYDTEDSCILGVSVKNLVILSTWRLGYVHFCPGDSWWVCRGKFEAGNMRIPL
jgi:hypothetical protein